jgi:DNA-binding NtrC family response regulator
MILTDNNPITAEDLMLSAENGQSTLTHIAAGDSLNDVEYKLIYDALESSKGSIKEASSRLGISYKTLQYRMKKFRLDKNDFR